MGPVERRIEMSSGRERVPRLGGGCARVPADSLGMECRRAERHEAAGKCGSLDRTSLLRQLTVRRGDTAFNWPLLSVTRCLRTAPKSPP